LDFGRSRHPAARGQNLLAVSQRHSIGFPEPGCM
jgi:hypothetical protein